MKSFLNSEKPIITAMMKSGEKSDLIAEIGRASKQGADAVGIQLDMLESKYKNRQDIRDIFSAAGDKPLYVTNYKKGNKEGEDISWEKLQEQLYIAIDCGATLIDVPGDMFSSSEYELTTNTAAIEKQKKFIDKIHRMGSEVLMSSHVLKYIPPESVLSVALCQKARGADISKIVTSADSEKELDDNFKALLLLKEKLDLPSLFLCNGSHCKQHRRIGPLLGSCMFLTVENDIKNQNQPTIETALKILKYGGL